MTSATERESAVVVISADGHAAPHTADYMPYFESRYHDDFAHYLSVHHHRFTSGHPDSVFVADLKDMWKGHRSFDEGGFGGVDDPQRRLQELDTDGVAAEIIFPDDTAWNAQPFCSGLEPMSLEQTWSSELRQAGARAHNRWLAEFCSADPTRLLGLISLGGLEHIDDAVAEIRRAHAAGLRTGVVLPLDYYLPLYHHPRYDPIWQTCVELDLSVAVHGADGGPSWYGDDQRAAGVWLMEVNFWGRRPLWCLVLGGVLDRFPDLRLVFTEQGSSWIPPTLDEMDAIAQSPVFRFATEQPLDLLPNEYWKRQCFVANSLMHRRRDFDDLAVSTSNYMWGADYPHVEGVWPEVRANMRELMGGRDEQTVRQFLGGMAGRAYRLDQAAITAAGRRVGPPLSEFASVPTEQRSTEVRITPVK